MQQMYLKYLLLKDKDGLPPTYFKLNLKCIFVIYSDFRQRIIKSFDA